MIVGRITAKSQVTVPRAVRLALGLEAGDDLVWEIDGDRVIVAKAGIGDDAVADFGSFTEWADELDSAYDNL